MCIQSPLTVRDEVEYMALPWGTDQRRKPYTLELLLTLRVLSVMQWMLEMRLFIFLSIGCIVNKEISEMNVVILLTKTFITNEYKRSRSEMKSNSIIVGWAWNYVEMYRSVKWILRNRRRTTWFGVFHYTVKLSQKNRGSYCCVLAALNGHWLHLIILHNGNN